jgi:hypothetical protein
MALDFAALQAEVFARGPAYLNDGGAGVTQVKRWINDAMHTIDDMYDWPYLNASTTGLAPLTIADLGKIEAVAHASTYQTLSQRSRGEMTDTYANLTTSGLGQEFYVTGGTTINVYPADTATTLTVTYWKVAPDLVAGGDVPLMPDRFRYAIVEYALVVAFRDESSQEAVAAQAAGDAIVARMTNWAGVLQPVATNVPLIGDDC